MQYPLVSITNAKEDPAMKSEERALMCPCQPEPLVVLLCNKALLLFLEMFEAGRKKYTHITNNEII